MAPRTSSVQKYTRLANFLNQNPHKTIKAACDQFFVSVSAFRSFRHRHPGAIVVAPRAGTNRRGRNPTTTLARWKEVVAYANSNKCSVSTACAHFDRSKVSFYGYKACHPEHVVHLAIVGATRGIPKGYKHTRHRVKRNTYSQP